MPSSFNQLLSGQVAVQQQDAPQLLSFIAREMQLFFAHMQAAVVQYNDTGELPASLFRGRGGKAGVKRKPSGERAGGACLLFSCCEVLLLGKWKHGADCWFWVVCMTSIALGLPGALPGASCGCWKVVAEQHLRLLNAEHVLAAAHLFAA